MDARCPMQRRALCDRPFRSSHSIAGRGGEAFGAFLFLTMLLSGCINAEEAPNEERLVPAQVAALGVGSTVVLEPGANVTIRYTTGTWGWLLIQATASMNISLDVADDPMPSGADGTLRFRHIVLDPRDPRGDSYNQVLEYHHPEETVFSDYANGRNQWVSTQPAILYPGVAYLLVVADSREHGEFILRDTDYESSIPRSLNLSMEDVSIQAEIFARESIGQLPARLALATHDLWANVVDIPQDSFVVEGGWMYYKKDIGTPAVGQVDWGEIGPTGCQGGRVRVYGVGAGFGLAFMIPEHHESPWRKAACVQLTTAYPGPGDLDGQFASTVVPLPPLSG